MNHASSDDVRSTLADDDDDTDFDGRNEQSVFIVFDEYVGFELPLWDVTEGLTMTGIVIVKPNPTR